MKYKKVTFAVACRCLKKSESCVRALMLEGCEFGKAIPGTGSRLNYVFYPEKLKKAVGTERFNEFFGIPA